MDRVIVTRSFMGIFCMQVCAVADATDEEILAVCNSQNKSGTTNGWMKVIRYGGNAPVACEDYPNRMHILVVC